MLKAIYEVAGGIPGGKKLKAVVPGGSSCPLLKAEECDIPMDYDTLAKVGSMLGSGGMVVMDETTDMVKFALRIMRFYAHESCGWCIPCREGTTWLRKILQRFDDGGGRKEDISLLGELSKNMLGRTFCALGDAAAMPTISIVDKFAEDFEKRLACSQKSQMVGGLENYGGNGKADDQRKAHRGREGHAADRSRAAERHRDSVVLLLRRAIRCRPLAACVWWKWRRLPSCRWAARCRWPKAWWCIPNPSRAERPQGDARIPADQSSAGLPGVRQGRRVRTAGHGVPLRRGRKPLHRAQGSRARAAMVAGGVLRCAALHSVLPLRARVR